MALFTLAACGGSNATPIGSSVTPTGATTPTAPPSVGLAATPAPTAPPTVAPTTLVPTAPPIVGPTTSPASTVGAVDLCSLLTADDLHTVIGGGWHEGALTSTGGYCHWDSGNSPDNQVITALQDGGIDTVNTVPGGVDITAGGLAGYSVADRNLHVQTTWVDIGGRLLIVEFPSSSNLDGDLTIAKKLAEIAVGNM